MTTNREQLDRLLATVGDGALDALTPEQVTRLEAHLNESPEAASRLADCVPPLDPRLAAPVRMPRRAEWERVRSAIASHGAARARPSAGWVHRFWRPLAAAAACVLLVAGWRTLDRRPAAATMLHLAQHAEINAIEAFGGSTALVLSSGDDAPVIIWVLDSGAELGA